VGRFHRTLKADIMCHADQLWKEALPLVLLGIRTAFNTDQQASVADLVYGELLTPTTDPVESAHLITKFRQHMAGLRPVPAAQYASPISFVHKASTIPRMSFSARTQFAGLWSPLTVDHGDRSRCNSLWAASPSPYRPTGLSRPTCWTRPTAGTQLSAQIQPRFRRPHHRRRKLRRLHAPDARSASTHASTSKQKSPGGGGGCRNLQQSSFLSFAGLRRSVS
jgi:hypothetical protein